MTGKNDNRARLKDVKKIYDNINTKKDLIIFENANHQDLIDVDIEKWLKALELF